MSAHVPGSWRLLYFDAPNRGEQVRMLFFLSGTAFHDVRLAYPKGLDPYKKAAMGDDSPLLGTDLCPAVTAPDGRHCVETAEIMRFVGQRVGLAPKADSPEDHRAMEVCLLAQACMNECFYALLKPMVVKHIFANELLGVLSRCSSLILGREAVYMKAPADKLASVLEAAEAALIASGGPYVCGPSLSYADISLFAILREVLEFQCFDQPALLAPHPKLKALLETLEAKAQPWIEQRVRKHQLGITSTVEYFAATNTPFPWSRKRKTELTG
uniref:GST C-terminal domain-containing protein n=1 Tax=Calcidiscus leptoporus TaxID=127549 RepID=A0A7S0JKJ7_9EUKA